METQIATNKGSFEKELFVKMVIKAWATQNTNLNKLLGSLTDEQLLKETAPGRNTGIYLLGHLVAVNDGLLPLFGFGQKLYPQLESIFLTAPDKSGHEMPLVSELRKYWNDINETLMQHINKMHPDEWFTKHSAVSDEDFVKEPHRNKLNVLISRTNHQSYHLGQLIFLK